MNAELLITGHYKEEGTAKYAKYAKNPNPSPQSRLGFAYFAYFAVQEIAWARILVAPWRLRLCVESSFISVKSVVLYRRIVQFQKDFCRKGFFAVFSGISWSGLPTWSNGLFFNPKGIGSSSPALARFIEGQRWVAQRKGFNPERVAYQRLMKEIQLFQSCDFPVNSPWVARSAQPRAERFNPFGIGLNPRCPRTAFGIPLKTAKNRAIHRKSLSINNLLLFSCFFNQAQSRLIKVNQG
jgi:hypothetical protein